MVDGSWVAGETIPCVHEGACRGVTLWAGVIGLLRSPSGALHSACSDPARQKPMLVSGAYHLVGRPKGVSG